MANKDGGVEADITVSVLENGDGSSVIKPKFEGEDWKEMSKQLFFNIIIIIIRQLWSQWL